MKNDLHPLILTCLSLAVINRMTGSPKSNSARAGREGLIQRVLFRFFHRCASAASVLFPTFKTWRLFFTAVSLVFCNLGCTTLGHRLTGIDRSVVEIRQAITKAIGEPVFVSPNGRSFKSKFFPRRADVTFNPLQAKERLFSEVTILGDSRPYDVDVLVYSQLKSGNGYSEATLDESQSRDLGLNIQYRLNQSRDEKNFIDDFRPF